MQMKEQLKDLFWVGASKKELGALPDEIVDMFGYALHLAQSGLKHEHAKPLKGFGGVLEVVEGFKRDTYRVVYTVKFIVLFMYCTVFKRNRHRALKHPSRIWTLSKNG